MVKKSIKSPLQEEIRKAETGCMSDIERFYAKSKEDFDSPVNIRKLGFKLMLLTT